MLGKSGGADPRLRLTSGDGVIGSAPRVLAPGRPIKLPLPLVDGRGGVLAARALADGAERKGFRDVASGNNLLPGVCPLFSEGLLGNATPTCTAWRPRLPRLLGRMMAAAAMVNAASN